MSDIPRPTVRTFRPLASLREGRPADDPGYAINAKAAAGDTSPSEATILLYGEIGGWWGVDAGEFVRALMALDVDRVRVHINSPGGSIYDGFAMFQALRNHKARVTTVVDGVAASAAGVVALAGDERVIGPYAEVMVHNPWGIAVGDSDDMIKASKDLERIGANMARLYADRAGGEVDAWREVMADETWYSSAEAVEAGLMHRVQADEEKAEESDDERMKARWDLSVYAFAGREKAPDPRIPGRLLMVSQTQARTAVAHEGDGDLVEQAPTGVDEHPAEPDNPKEKEDVLSTLNAVVRQWLGLADDTDDTAIEAAVQARQAEHEAQAAKLADLEAKAQAAEAALAAKTQASEALAEKVTQLAELVESQGSALAAIKAEKVAAEKAAVLDAAQKAGKFAPADREKWSARYDKAPEVTAEVLDSIPAGAAVPMAAKGHTGPAEPVGGEDDEIARLEAMIHAPVTSKGV